VKYQAVQSVSCNRQHYIRECAALLVSPFKPVLRYCRRRRASVFLAVCTSCVWVRPNYSAS